MWNPPALSVLLYIQLSLENQIFSIIMLVIHILLLPSTCLLLRFPPHTYSWLHFHDSMAVLLTVLLLLVCRNRYLEGISVMWQLLWQFLIIFPVVAFQIVIY